MLQAFPCYLPRPEVHKANAKCWLCYGSDVHNLHINNPMWLVICSFACNLPSVTAAIQSTAVDYCVLLMTNDYNANKVVKCSTITSLLFFMDPFTMTSKMLSPPRCNKKIQKFQFPGGRSINFTWRLPSVVSQEPDRVYMSNMYVPQIIFTSVNFSSFIKVTKGMDKAACLSVEFQLNSVQSLIIVPTSSVMKSIYNLPM